jgi:nicotinic acid phosphoribosyltransferase
MFAKPIGRQTRHLFERAGLLKEMRGVRHDSERLFTLKLRIRALIQSQNVFIAFAHD